MRTNANNHRGSREFYGLRLQDLLELLQRHEGDLKYDIRQAVTDLQRQLGDARTTHEVAPAKRCAAEVKKVIADNTDHIAPLSYQLSAGSSRGVASLLSKEPEQALQRPERVLILSMFFVFVVFSLGAFAFQYLRFYQFGLVTGFALTAVIVLNAFYSRTIDKLSEAGFLRLMQLALLKFFSPLLRRT
jgi:hypothetical protein